jgi:hypothetical protein
MTSAERAKDLRLRTIYQMTLEQHNAKREEQGNKCAICGRDFSKFQAYQDHSHDCCARKKGRYCGKCNRALLCFICNKKVIGSIERWEKLGVDIEVAIEYLRHWSRVLTLRGAYAAKKETPKLRKKQKGV